MKHYHELDNLCEVCGKMEFAGNLYMDIFNEAWIAMCPDCFYKLYSREPENYYSRMKKVGVDLKTERQYERVKNAKIVIVNAFPYIVEDGTSKEFDQQAIDQLEKQSCDLFIGSEKIKRKFNVYNAQCKSSIKTDTTGAPALIVAVRAWVNFKSWLEYMEHESYMFMRNEIDNMIIH